MGMRGCRLGQSLSAQVAELKASGAQRVFQEKVNGARSDRKQLKRLLSELDEGDIVLVTRLDRLAPSTRELLNILATIGEAKASFRSLRDAWADTTTPHGRLILTVVGGLAEFERHLMASRTSEARKRAKARGVLFGRPPSASLADERTELKVSLGLWSNRVSPPRHCKTAVTPGVHPVGARVSG